MNWIVIISIIGLIASLYAYYIEIKKNKDSSYKAVCDINYKVSCTKAYTSEYGKLFGFSNALGGAIFYILMIAISFFEHHDYVFYLALVSVAGSMFLWYVLTFRVKTICVVCYSVYLINIALLLVSYFQMR